MRAWVTEDHEYWIRSANIRQDEDSCNHRCGDERRRASLPKVAARGDLFRLKLFVRHVAKAPPTPLREGCDPAACYPFLDSQHWQITCIWWLAKHLDCAQNPSMSEIALITTVLS
jgi:hypothetical protein